MTTIVAIQQKDKVIFGADSQTTSSDGRKSNHPKMVKITERGDFLIAGSGECAPCDIAQHIWIPPKPTATDLKDVYHFMISKVVPSLKACFKDNEYKWNESDDGETKFAFLLAIGGEVFELAEDMSISLDSKGFYGIGSGSNYAIGALAAGAGIEIALAIAAENDAYTSAPFIYKTQNKKVLAKPRTRGGAY
jgi:ATP-dependent protease HslVU (ClpYQ) peptidase subunit